MISRRGVSKLFIGSLLLASTPARAEPVVLLQPGDAPLVALLPPPPADDSETTKDEIAAYHAMAASRTKEQADFAVADDDASIIRFLAGMDIKVEPKQIPMTLKFCKDLGATQAAFISPAKEIWTRTRMSIVDPSIKTLIELPHSTAYPSGHATLGMIFGIMSARMAPEKRNAFLTRGVQFGHSRFVVGVHYPSDNEAARTAGAVISNAVLHNKACLETLGRCTPEFRRVLGYK
jgi:acid phosphatase (class A)